MIDVSPYEHCACQKMGNTQALCTNDLCIEEKGKKLRLSLRANEEARVLVLDGCVFTDNKKKCDAVYLFRRQNTKVVALVELKGAGDLPHAFEQLAYTKRQRPEYGELREKLNAAGPGQLIERAFVVSNGMLSKPEHEALENRHGIRVTAILYSEPSAKAPDLREWL